MITGVTVALGELVPVVEGLTDNDTVSSEDNVAVEHEGDASVFVSAMTLDVGVSERDRLLDEDPLGVGRGDHVAVMFGESEVVRDWEILRGTLSDWDVAELLFDDDADGDAVNVAEPARVSVNERDELRDNDTDATSLIDAVTDPAEQLSVSVEMLLDKVTVADTEGVGEAVVVNLLLHVTSEPEYDADIVSDFNDDCVLEAEASAAELEALLEMVGDSS